MNAFLLNLGRRSLSAAIFVAALFHALSAISAAPHDKPSNASLSQQIQASANTVMQQHAVPGMAIVVIKDGKVAFEKGFGVTKIVGGTKVGESTLFKVGSISKSMTALALALLVQDAKLKWNDPLSRHLPDLKAAYPAVARLTLRQVLSHQTGVDLDQLEPLLWPQPNQFEFADIVTGLKVLATNNAKLVPPVSAEDALNTGIFRYSNVHYAIAGEVIQRVSGARYATYMQREIFAPLKMNCVVSNENAALAKSVAQPHALVNGVVQLVRADFIEGEIAEGLDAAAGGVRCDANALGKWLQFQLNPCASALKLSDALWRELHTGLAATRTDFNAALQPTAIETYGLGLQIVAEEGEARYDHYGGVAGMLSYFAAYPARNSGFAVMLNMGDGKARAAITSDLQRVIAGKPALVERSRKPAQIAVEADRVTGKAAPLKLAIQALDNPAQLAYFGRYEDAWFGEISLCHTATGATFTSHKSPRFIGKLAALADGGVAVFWTDGAINSDAAITPAPSQSEQPQKPTPNNKVQTFKLAALGESDFDFTALQFRRIGDCAGL